MAHLRLILPNASHPEPPMRVTVPTTGALRVPPHPCETPAELAWTPTGLRLTTSSLPLRLLAGSTRADAVVGLGNAVWSPGSNSAWLGAGSVIRIDGWMAEVVIDDEDLFARITQHRRWRICGVASVTAGHQVAVRIDDGQRGTVVVVNEEMRSGRRWLLELRRAIANDNAPAWVLALLTPGFGESTSITIMNRDRHVIFEDISGISLFRLKFRLFDEAREPDAAIRLTVASAVLRALLDAEQAPMPDEHNIILTWDGAVHCPRRPLSRPASTHRYERLRSSLRRLRTHSADWLIDGLQKFDDHLFDVIDDVASDYLHDAIDVDDDPHIDDRLTSLLQHVLQGRWMFPMPVPTGPTLTRDELAGLLRGLFPEAWQAEQTRREQLAIAMGGSAR